MKNAWVEYNPITNTIIKISWNAADTRSIKIDGNLATDFMFGKEQLSNWEILYQNNEASLHRKATELSINTVQIPVYNVIKLDDAGDQTDLIITSNQITIFTVHNYKNAVLHVTMKNDPSWVIATYDIGNTSEHSNVAVIDIVNAAFYSYYIGRPH